MTSSVPVRIFYYNHCEQCLMKKTKGKTINKKSIGLYDLVDTGNSQKVFAEVKDIVLIIEKNVDKAFLEEIFNDTLDLFKGRYPGYRASNAKYHDLQHTQSVALAAARMMHGCFAKGHSFTPRNILLGITAALFHDIGYIQAEDDREGSGAKYTIGHEKRSIDFMTHYLTRKNFTTRDIRNCERIIQCTMLNVLPQRIHFRSKEIELLGMIVGSADLVAQMADRLYLEKLLLLFIEFKEASLPGCESLLTLLRKTADFYEFVAYKRLKTDLGDVCTSMRLHFVHRWDIDRDLYEEMISKNIKYIKYLNRLCGENIECYLKNLKRGAIVKETFDEIL